LNTDGETGTSPLKLATLMNKGNPNEKKIKKLVSKRKMKLKFLIKYNWLWEHSVQ
jgi:hypothetical protein